MKTFYENKIEHLEQTICSMKVREDQSEKIKEYEMFQRELQELLN
jgi:hypothetical protein